MEHSRTTRPAIHIGGGSGADVGCPAPPMKKELVGSGTPSGCGDTGLPVHAGHGPSIGIIGSG